MKINPFIFKSYDIRGVYPQDLNEETACRVGEAFVRYSGARNVVVGRDGRLSSPFLFKALIKGITSQKAAVYDIGKTPTEGVYFAVGHYDYQAGIMITASHNPKEYNGFKMLKKEKNGRIIIIRGRDILEKVKKISNKNLIRKKEKKEKKETKKIDIWQDYLEHIFSFINLKKIKSFKIVVDASNGMAGKVIPRLKGKLPLKIIPLNFNLDGNFPAHSPNPLLKNATEQISRKIKKEKADFGFIFDGDADRVFLLDEKGKFVSADITLLFLAKFFLKKNPGKAVSYNAVCSRAVPEFVKKWGGRPLRTKVGFVNVREGMLKNDGIMGGELSGHYSFRGNFYLDSGAVAFLVLLQLISESGKKVSKMVYPLSLYKKNPEISFKAENKEELLAKIKKQYSDGKQDFLDGLTVGYDRWWFNLRASQTEPLLRLTIEAETESLLEKKKKELLNRLNPR